MKAGDLPFAMRIWCHGGVVSIYRVFTGCKGYAHASGDRLCFSVISSMRCNAADGSALGSNIMAQVLRAVYRAGTLRLTQPVALHEGDEVSIAILPLVGSTSDANDAATLSVASGNPVDPLTPEHLRVLEQQLYDLTAGVAPLSSTIIDEREQGW